MKVLWPLTLAVFGTVGLIAAGLAQTPGEPTAAPAGSCERSLTPDEEAIVRSPFPSEAASQRLVRDLLSRRQYGRGPQTLPEAQPQRRPDNGGMGWTVSDAEYWRRIPPAARAIPTDWSKLPLVRFTNTEIDGVREIRLAAQGEYDLWLLNDPRNELIACISVHRPTRRVWFMQIACGENGAWGLKRAKDPCYFCHPSGPRIIRPLAEPGIDRERLAQFNRRMFSYGACDFGDSVDRGTRGQPLADARCSGCHDGVDRGKLYAIHASLNKFKTEEQATMPPAEPR